MRIKEILKITVKSWMRNPLNTIISFVSFTVGITCSVILVIFINNEFRIASALNDNGNVYVIEKNNAFHDDKLSVNTNPHWASSLAESFPEIEALTTIFEDFMVFTSPDERGNSYLEKSFQASPEFADIFDLKIITGDLKQTLSSPEEIAITVSTGKKLFGDENPIGKTINYERSIYGSDLQETGRVNTILTVTCIIDDSEKNILDFNSLSYFYRDRYSDKGIIGIYVNILKLRDGVSAKEFAERLEEDVTKNRSYPDIIKERIYLKHMGDIYFSNTEHPLFRYQDKTLVNISIPLLIVILTIACFNFINLSMSRAPRMIRLFALKRILGAARSEIFVEVIVETVFQIAICSLMSIYFLNLSIPVFNGFMGTDLKIEDLLITENFIIVGILLFVVTVLPSLFIFSKTNQSSFISLS
ncbi:MAG: ABC transporter permease [Rikenellaceae bacterium]|nr:ABC transporter permease [Rikenellaceae bacterium]